MSPVNKYFQSPFVIAFNVLGFDLKKERVSMPYSFHILDLIVKLELTNICINLYGNQSLTITIHFSKIWYSIK